MEIKPSANGGHTITHRMKREVKAQKMGEMYMDRPKDEDYAFGPGEGAKAMAHVAEHAAMKGKPGKGEDCPMCGGK